MVTEVYDYSAFKDDEIPVGANLLARISGLAADQLQAEARVLQLTEDLKQAVEHLRHIAENQMPQLMEEAGGMDHFSTREGLEVKIKTAIRGSIPKANETEAFEWLEDNDHAELIKRNFIIDFGKAEEKWADKFERDLAQRKKPLNVKRKRTVNANTLKAFVKTALEDGVPIPMDVFGVFRQNFATVKLKEQK